VVLREVPPVAESIVQGDVYVLDKGSQLLQLNTKESVGKEKFSAADFVRKLVERRRDEGKLTGECEIVVYGTYDFLYFSSPGNS
jgi:gelsolin